MKIETYEDFLSFVKQVTNKFQMLTVQIHSYIFESGTDVVPYFRLMWSPDRLAPVVSFHVDTRNSDAIQFFTAIFSMAENIVLSESYFISQAGETYIGDEAFVASQVEIESAAVETTTDATINEKELGATFISSIPVYTKGDPRAEEQKKAMKKRKQGLFNL